MTFAIIPGKNLAKSQALDQMIRNARAAGVKPVPLKKGRAEAPSASAENSETQPE